MAGAEPAVTANVAVEDEDATLSEAGADSAGPPLETAILTPPAGAGAESVTVQVLVEPAMMLVGSHDSAARPSELRFKATLVKGLKLPVFKLAAMITLWLVVTMPAVAVKTPEVAPAGTGTEAGRVSTELLAVNCTVCDATA